MPPISVEAFISARADLVTCRRLLRDGSRSFHVASRLLPDGVRDAATALYAFCRVADDLVDVEGGGDASVAALRERIDRVYRGCPQARATDRAFARVVEEYGIPRALPDALVEGLEWDAQLRRYSDFDALTEYAARVAASVGAMMAMLMGARSGTLVARACDLGVAMQLTNIARDVGEDASMGRVYLPLEWLGDAGVDADAWLARPVFDDRIAAVTRRLLAAAAALYARADAGIAGLPRGCRPGIRAARLVYSSIGSAVERRGFDSVNARAFVSTQRKLALGARAYWPLPSPVADLGAAPLQATQYLVDAVASARGHERSRAPSWTDRVIWAFELFDRLERDERARVGQSSPGQASAAGLVEGMEGAAWAGSTTD